MSRHRCQWKIIREQFTEPNYTVNIGALNVKGRGPEPYAMMERHYETIDRLLYGATSIVYECACGLRKTDLLVGDARSTT